MVHVHEFNRIGRSERPSNMRYDIPWVYAEVGQQVEPVSESKTNADRAVAND